LSAKVTLSLGPAKSLVSENKEPFSQGKKEKKRDKGIEQKESRKKGKKKYVLRGGTAKILVKPLPKLYEYGTRVQ